MICSHKSQTGLSLVELLVAIALGLILTAGALQMMLSSQGLYRTTDSLSRIQESGRFALNFLAKDIRMAGYETEDRKTFFEGACGDFNPCTADGGGANNDRIGVMLTPSQPIDCLGNAINTNPIDSDDTDIINVYYLQTENNISSLYCRGYDSDTGLWNSVGQPLIDGVENFQILYGVINNSGDIEQYVPASAAVDYNEVTAVRVALLINNGQAIGSGNLEIRNFTLLNAPQQAFNDKHERQIYSATIAVNNVIYPTDPTD